MAKPTREMKARAVVLMEVLRYATAAKQGWAYAPSRSGRIMVSAGQAHDRVTRALSAYRSAILTAAQPATPRPEPTT